MVKLLQEWKSIARFPLLTEGGIILPFCISSKQNSTKLEEKSIFWHTVKTIMNSLLCTLPLLQRASLHELLPPANEFAGRGRWYFQLCLSISLSTWRGVPCDHYPWWIGPHCTGSPNPLPSDTGHPPCPGSILLDIRHVIPPSDMGLLHPHC